MSIDSAALLQTICTIRKQLTRGITVAIENFHEHYHLRNMEYYCETDCYNAPTISISPGKWGIGAFRSSMTCGTRGLLTYELQSESFALTDRLFLIIGWHVPLVGDNSFFLHVAQVESPDFPTKEAERVRVYEFLSRKKMRAGKSIFCYVSPEIVDDQKQQVKEKEDGKADNMPKSCLTVCASMATTSMANLRVEIHPYQFAQDEQKTEGTIHIAGPPQKFSFTKLMEERFANAEIKVNDALEKFLGIKPESTVKDTRKNI
ncbi:4740_t:CDS:2 [Paraglomus occultum]|uniref:4740_t:CDS:1 n=1 Tax=Paraglomus occultum TaxID=144539 RepID=A0A9N9C372_9GLOM|nr:4740_t:CDS:2 [Paraglomus occultum]